MRRGTHTCGVNLDCENTCSKEANLITKRECASQLSHKIAHRKTTAYGGTMDITREPKQNNLYMRK